MTTSKNPSRPVIDSEKLLDRFLRYVQIDTESRASSTSFPSTPGQWDLLRALAEELRELGVKEVELDPSGFTFATIPARGSAKEGPTIGLLAHVDTTEDVTGKDVKPIVHRNYDGRPIVLPDDPTKVLDPKAIPYLAKKLGETVITASGKTLLGADDKSGVAVLVTVVETLRNNPSLPHPEIRICFNPDEEIARGMDNLNLEKFRCRAAYTLDADSPGQFSFESFSADSADIVIRGVPSHPGWGKGVLVNAINFAGKFIDRLVSLGELPENSCGREGFFHLLKIGGDALEARIHLIVRDFELDGLERRGKTLEALAEALIKEEPRLSVTVNVSPQYRNMRYWLDKDKEPVDRALAAMAAIGIPPNIHPIRGGTDGSKLTEKGIPTPNIFCGFQNIHSQLEWVALEDMVLSVRFVVELLRNWAEEAH